MFHFSAGTGTPVNAYIIMIYAVLLTMFHFFVDIYILLLFIYFLKFINIENKKEQVEHSVNLYNIRIYGCSVLLHFVDDLKKAV